MPDFAALALGANHVFTAANVAVLLGAAWRISAWKKGVERDLDEGKRMFTRHEKRDCNLSGGLAEVNQQLSALTHDINSKMHEMTIKVNEQLSKVNVTLARIDERQQQGGKNA